MWCLSQQFQTISVLNQNLLQQVEMWLCHVYFHHILQHHVGNCTCVLRHFMKILEDIASSAYVKTLAYTTGTTSKHQMATWPELYPKSIIFLRIVAWHMSVCSLATRLRLWCRDAAMLSKMSKKRISTPNFETSLHQNVTANKRIGNIYFMYVDMAWFKSLSRLEHDMLYSTVWPVHKIYPMPVCWQPNLTRTKIVLKSLSSRESHP